MNDPHCTPEDSRAADTPLTNLAQIFRGIKAGRHWCFGDPEYADLNSKRFDAYKGYFGQIGIEIHRDDRGFIFATVSEEDSRPSQVVSSLVVFAAFWVEHLSDKGLDIHRTLFEGSHFIDDLPHLTALNHRSALEQAGLNTAAGIKTTLGHLDRMGFIDLSASGRFTLRRSFLRLLDVCPQYVSTAPGAEEPDQENPSTLT